MRPVPDLPNRLPRHERQAGSDAWLVPIGYIIRRLREIRGYTQGELACRASANLSYISALENHPSNISIRKIQHLCNALDIAPILMVRACQAFNHAGQTRPAYEPRPVACLIADAPDMPAF